MKKLLLYLILLSIIITVLFKTISYWPETKVKHLVYVYIYSEQYIDAMKEVEKKGYVSIQWLGKSSLREESSLAWVAGEPKYKKVDKPDLSRIVKPFEDSAIHALWLQNYGGAWLVRKAFSYKGENGIGEGMYAFGNVNPKDVCLPNTHCVEHLFGQWYVIKN
ncbi:MULTISPECIES: hypothetical protein [unclassified Pseudoalteromonas]|uniref:hypothetical protein n=1 Tax=unclassified Pseudoalteromonas TaxID=194690 RepID=UPI002097D4CE|nr:hypothetical protein [Pseudoalteromonas sp. XMcav2-N]MCO7187187.1 hypothetical protein [Pseudoalteromonas sp. XMcav2-N]